MTDRHVTDARRSPSSNSAFTIVVVVAFETDDELGALLRSLKATVTAPSELIVVDNGDREREAVVCSTFGQGSRLIKLGANRVMASRRTPESEQPRTMS
jgi:hypothetical protein